METLGSLSSSKKFTINPVQAPTLFLEGVFLILFSNLLLSHPSGFFTSGFSTVRATCPNLLILLDLIIIFSDQCRLRSSSLCSLIKSPVKFTRLIFLELSNLYWLWSYNEILSSSNYTFPYNGYRFFPGGKVRPGRAANHSPPSSAVVMEE